MNFKRPCFDAINNESQDKFGFNNGAKKLVNIFNNTELPNAFGVYGIWGSGKTSLMKLTKKLIDESRENNKIATLWFDPWKYEYEKNVPIVYPLLFQIQKTLKDESLKTFLENSGKFLGTLGLATSGTAIKLISGGAIDQKLKDISDDVDVASNVMYSKYEQWASSMDDFHDEFEKKLNAALKTNGVEKLYIFVDDMDRCLQENAIELIEIMKNYLNVNNTLFIFGMDRRVIIDHINTKYPSQDNNYGQEYLEKIIPLSIDIPSNDPLKFIDDILIKILGSSVPVEEIKLIVEYLDKFCKSNRRLINVIFHKYLVCLTYLNITSLKADLLATRNRQDQWENDSACRIGVLRMCILQERIPTFFDQYNWVEKYDEGRGKEEKNFTEKLIHRISSCGELHNIYTHVITSNPLVPMIYKEDASIIISHITNDLFA